MATLHSSIHLHAEDKISFGQGATSRWLNLGEDMAVFCSDEKLGELRHAIDAHLANRFAMAAPVQAEAVAA